MRTSVAAALLPALLLLVSACEPRVRLEAPKDPIVINLNVKIEREVRVKIEREVEDVLTEEPGIF